MYKIKCILQLNKSVIKFILDVKKSFRPNLINYFDIKKCKIFQTNVIKMTF